VSLRWSRHPFLRLGDGTHPLAARTCETPAACPGQADQTGIAGGCLKTWDPGRQVDLKTARAASADSEVRPGPRPRPYARIRPNRGGRAGSGEAGSAALSTSSLPTRSGWELCRSRGGRAQMSQFWRRFTCAACSPRCAACSTSRSTRCADLSRVCPIPQPGSSPRDRITARCISAVPCASLHG
jgi:hypothetical protein